jgi:hypothetical protein
MTKFSVYIGIDWANDKHDVCVQVANGDKKRRRQSKMTTSECMTIVSAFINQTTEISRTSILV